MKGLIELTEQKQPTKEPQPDKTGSKSVAFSEVYDLLVKPYNPDNDPYGLYWGRIHTAFFLAGLTSTLGLLDSGMSKPLAVQSFQELGDLATLCTARADKVGNSDEAQRFYHIANSFYGFMNELSTNGESGLPVNSGIPV